MTRSLRPGSVALASLAILLMPTWARCADAPPPELKRDFQAVVKPFVNAYCIGCHGGAKPKAKFDLSPYQSMESVASDLAHWAMVLQRLNDGDMPPDDAKKRPAVEERKRVIEWLGHLRRYEAQRTAGDPGPVLARRLSNAEYNYAIQDLTGIDIRPTRDFPVDPANAAGFDNTGESLAMSPALLTKYLGAARQVADHLLLFPNGIDFAPHPVVVYSDRDKFGVHRIVDFYNQQPTDPADYFAAAWRFRHRSKLGLPDATIADVAQSSRVSPKYLAAIWSLLTDDQDQAGPVAELRDQWNRLPAPSDKLDEQSKVIRAECEKLRTWVRAARKSLELPISNYAVRQLNGSNQALILAKDREVAANRRRGRLPAADGKPETDQLRAAVTRFCSIFPNAFFISERGRMYEKEGLDRALDPSKRSSGRLLSAGFHLMLGYFRDDAPLYDLILDEPQRQHLDRMWRDLEFITQAPIRQFSDFIYFERAEFPSFLKGPEFDFAREDTDIMSQAKIELFATRYLAKCRQAKIEDRYLQIIDSFFKETASNIRHWETVRSQAEPSHLKGLAAFAERAWRRPLTHTDRDELLGFYRASRKKLNLSHDDAVRDTLVFILMSPRFSFRALESKPGRAPRALSGHELANRLSFFLWSSVPDEELLAHAVANDLHEPKVLTGQARRMLKDPKARRLATEFGGHWLEFRRFQTHNGVNRERFPVFTDELRQAMFEEPIHFIVDLIQRDGSVLEFIEARHTFVNKVLATHYRIPFDRSAVGDWIRVDDADRYGRGGLLPMSAFLTMSAPGLRTSPVKRGYWVVRRLLGEQIPPPPPDVPELPKDESKLGELSVRDLLAKHRDIPSCAKCHHRFDSIGLVFEGFGPVGERRDKDLGGRPVDSAAVFPDGSRGDGLAGLKQYLRTARQPDFIDHLARKLLAYGLGRSLLLSDEATVEAMKQQLKTNAYRFSTLIETVVTSPQFLQVRGRDFDKETNRTDD